ncbi:exodeoxyribonuclease V subunit beta [Picosynechococcus sp. NKBG042902]|uniref:UvrD-helicase domain-containing protein n=1 Tax=Picosynechococcus sp. NKBG042902 TaxID=490193 RepID=UPI0004AB9A71|nr:UvrD-helicase domain-containing protein [Picosynechococcus sp. NKBG042902]
MPLTEQQEKAVTSKTSVSITAGAGTGKTHMLAARYLHHLDKDKLSPLQVVAMTFTEKAATELRARIRQAIAQEHPDRFDWLAEVEAAQISTFHAVAMRICREHPEAAGVPANFQPLDEWEGSIWQAEQLNVALAEMPPELYGEIPYSTLKTAIAALLGDPLSAREALKRSCEDWLPALRDKQQQVIKNLLASETWQETQALMTQYQGAPGDKLELVRQTLAELMADLERSQDDITSVPFQSTLQALKSLKVGSVGSKKNWPSEDILKTVRSQAIACRDFVQKFPDISLLGLTLGELDERETQWVMTLQGAFQWLEQRLKEIKQQARVLDFNDLEIYALKALEDPAVRDYYKERWRAYLIDEFQDTNPTQGKLLEALTGKSILTIVGDDKQSIYGFRRADVEVFRSWRSQLNNGVALTQSFRTHESLVNNINTVFRPVLGDLHQDLDAHRQEAPHDPFHLDIYRFAPEEKMAIAEARKVEAQQIAQLIYDMLSQGMKVWDKPTDTERAIVPKDIAILSRTWDPLDIYSQALAQWQIPFLQSSGGNLLDTPEALDGLSLLQFIANPNDDLALVAVLRSPFLTLSDRLLYELRPQKKDKKWWSCLKDSQQPEVQQRVTILKQLLNKRDIFTPSQLLQLADQLTGYSAVITNLPQAERRLADWQGFLELLRHLEQGTADVLSVVRRLQRFQRHGVKIPRPPLEADDAVSLMTIHAAKGLEWSVVIVPDLTRKLSNTSSSILFDPEFGVALKQRDDQGKLQKSVLFQLLEGNQQERETAEAKRVLYVALTRARDRLILTTPKEKGGGLDLLQPGLEDFAIKDISPDLYPPAEPWCKGDESSKPQQPPQLLLEPARSYGLELPMTALTTYARCPKKFYFEQIIRHPGLTEGESNYGAAIGSLTHTALEKDYQTVEQLNFHNQDLKLPPDKVQEALDLAQTFRTDPVFAAVQAGEKEVALELRQNQLVLNGRADLVGANCVLDVKTDSKPNPIEHRFQLWAYARAAEKPTAYIAYLRQQQLYTFTPTDLKSIDQEADILMQQIAQRDYTPKPDSDHCSYCPYSQICDAGKSVLPEELS